MLVVMLSHLIVHQNSLAGPECAGHTTGTQPIPDNKPTNTCSYYSIWGYSK